MAKEKIVPFYHIELCTNGDFRIISIAKKTYNVQFAAE